MSTLRTIPDLLQVIADATDLLPLDDRKTVRQAATDLARRIQTNPAPTVSVDLRETERIKETVERLAQEKETLFEEIERKDIEIKRLRDENADLLGMNHHKNEIIDDLRKDLQAGETPDKASISLSLYHEKKTKGGNRMICKTSYKGRNLAVFCISEKQVNRGYEYVGEYVHRKFNELVERINDPEAKLKREHEKED